MGGKTFKASGLAIVLLFFTVTTAALAQQESYAPVPPAPLEKGWNLISVPCDIALSDFRQGYGNKDLKAYVWDGAAFSEVDALKRGRGYFINANQVLNPSSICKPSAANTSTTVTLAPGWNLIGNPYHRVLMFSELFSGPNQKIPETIYGLKKGQAKELHSWDYVKPWEGYWVFSAGGTSFNVSDTCKVSVTLLGNTGGGASYITELGVPLEFKAIAKSSEGPYANTDEDVTAFATWSVSTPEIGGFDAGAVLTPKATGTVEISAGYCGVYADPFNVEVVGGDVKRVLIIRTSRQISDGHLYPYLKSEHGQKDVFKAEVTYSMPGESPRVQNVTQAVDWLSAEPAVGTVDSSGVFTAAATGSTLISASFMGATSTPIAVTVSAKTCNGIYTVFRNPDWAAVNYVDSGMLDSNESGRNCFEAPYPGGGISCMDKLHGSYVVGRGGTVDLTAYCNQDGHYIDITGMVTWESINESTATSAGQPGSFMTKANGIASFRASYNGQTSNTQWLRVMDRQDKYTNISTTVSNYPDWISCRYLRGWYEKLCGEVDYVAYPGGFVYMSVKGNKETTVTDGSLNVTISKVETDLLKDAHLKTEAPDVVEIEKPDKIISRSPGKSTVTITLGNTEVGVRMAVLEYGKLATVMISPDYQLVEPGASATYTVKAYYTEQNRMRCEDNMRMHLCVSSVDVTAKVVPEMSNASLGTVSGGIFQSNGTPGKATMTAVYDGARSRPAYINVKKPEWFGLVITDSSGIVDLDYGIFTVEKGKARALGVLAFETDNINRYVDVSNDAKWEISDPSIATISSDGVLTGLKPGTVWLRASVGDARSSKTRVVVYEPGFTFLMLYAPKSTLNIQENRLLKKGSSIPITAKYFTYMPPGTCNASKQECFELFQVSDVTCTASFDVSDKSIAEFETRYCSYYYAPEYYLKGLSPGFVDISATYLGLTSNTLTIDVWDESTINYCDESNKNSGTWEGWNSKATLETNCSAYTPGDPVQILYSAEVAQGMLTYTQNCVDLNIVDAAGNVVRTLRYEGCSSESLAKAASANYELTYQTKSTWDMKDDAGNTVPPGKYFAVARFSILWDPVIRVPITIVAQ